MAFVLGASVPPSVWAAWETILYTVGGASAAGLLLSSIAPGSDEERRALRKAERRLKFWRSRLGQVIFRISGMGLHKRVTEVRATHRPTELQIGLAVEALFAALPKETRREVGDIPANVATLEADASRLREYVNLLKDAESAGIERNVKFPADLRETREGAERQLSDVVAALETIRLELLRLTAGVGSVAGLTTHLAAAGQVRSNVGHLLDGMEEVQAALEIADSGELPVPDAT